MNIAIMTIKYFFLVLQCLLILRAILSWLPLAPDHPINKITYRLTEPILGPVRELLEKSIFSGGNMMIDFSPIIAYIFIEIAKNILILLVR